MSLWEMVAAYYVFGGAFLRGLAGQVLWSLGSR